MVLALTFLIDVDVEIKTLSLSLSLSFLHTHINITRHNVLLLTPLRERLVSVYSLSRAWCAAVSNLAHLRGKY